MLNRGAALNFRELPAPPNSAAWAAAWRPYVEVCIELFGAERCNFESNFPVDKMGTRLRGAVERIQTHHRRMLTDREARPLQRHGETALPPRLRGVELPNHIIRHRTFPDIGFTGAGRAMLDPTGRNGPAGMHIPGLGNQVRT
jgi:hypothetical protein